MPTFGQHEMALSLPERCSNRRKCVPAAFPSETFQSVMNMRVPTDLHNRFTATHRIRYCYCWRVARGPTAQYYKGSTRKDMAVEEPKGQGAFELDLYA